VLWVSGIAVINKLIGVGQVFQATQYDPSVNPFAVVICATPGMLALVPPVRFVWRLN
jgi:hypothetical protein